MLLFSINSQSPYKMLKILSNPGEVMWKFSHDNWTIYFLHLPLRQPVLPVTVTTLTSYLGFEEGTIYEKGHWSWFCRFLKNKVQWFRVSSKRYTGIQSNLDAVWTTIPLTLTEARSLLDN